MKVHKKSKGGAQGFNAAHPMTKGAAVNKTSLALHPNIRPKIQDSGVSKKHKGHKGASNKNPSFGKVAKSVARTMGYK